MKTRKQNIREKRQRRRKEKIYKRTFKDGLKIFYRKYFGYCSTLILLGYITYVGLGHNILNSKLGDEGIKTKAIILDLEFNKYKKRNKGYYYRFYVDSIEYGGHTTTQNGIIVGDSIEVYYLSDKPEKNKGYMDVE